MTVVRGLDNILSGNTEFVTIEEGKPQTFLFIDWYQELVGIREHYEKHLNPKYIRCPGKEICPLCLMNPDKYPALRIKFRVYDPSDKKVKFMSLAKKHINSLNGDFTLDEIDPTKTFVTIYRKGKEASDTIYSGRAAKGEYEKPDFEELDMPDLTPQITPHTVDQIRNILNAVTGGQAPAEFPPTGAEPVGDLPPRKMPF